MKAKKLIALFLAAAFAVTSFAACSAAETSSTSESSTSSDSSEVEDDSDAALVALGGADANGQYWDGDIEISAPGEVPIVLGDKITISAFTAPHQTACSVFDYGTNDFTTQLEDETNIHIEWTVVTSADKTAKLNLLFQSDEYEDLIFSSWFDGAATYTYSQQGYLAPLSVYFDTQGYYYLEWYDALIESGATTEEAMSSAYMPDGNLYSFTLLNDAFNAHYSNRLWVYEPWLETLDIDMPTTTEEFEEMLIAFRDEDPNGNGEADEIPLTGSYSNGWNCNPTIFLMNSFVYTDAITTGKYIEDDNVVITTLS
ncbi:MAG: extracellular solute-binding protein, partial [Clostridia bacterium]